MPLTDSYVTVARYIETLLVNNKTTLGLQDVFYGDQERIPRTPAAVVEPGGKQRTLNGAPRRTQVDITAYVIIYHYNLKNIETLREDNDRLAEQIEATIHQDAQMKDGTGNMQVVDSMVTAVESGFQPKGNSLFRASRLTIEARSQAQLPSSL